MTHAGPVPADLEQHHLDTALGQREGQHTAGDAAADDEDSFFVRHKDLLV